MWCFRFWDSKLHTVPSMNLIQLQIYFVLYVDIGAKSKTTVKLQCIYGVSAYFHGKTFVNLQKICKLANSPSAKVSFLTITRLSPDLLAVSKVFIARKGGQKKVFHFSGFFCGNVKLGENFFGSYLNFKVCLTTFKYEAWKVMLTLTHSS